MKLTNILEPKNFQDFNDFLSAKGIDRISTEINSLTYIIKSIFKTIVQYPSIFEVNDIWDYNQQEIDALFDEITELDIIDDWDNKAFVKCINENTKYMFVEYIKYDKTIPVNVINFSVLNNTVYMFVDYPNINNRLDIAVWNDAENADENNMLYVFNGEIIDDSTIKIEIYSPNSDAYTWLISTFEQNEKGAEMQQIGNLLNSIADNVLDTNPVQDLIDATVEEIRDIYNNLQSHESLFYLQFNSDTMLLSNLKEAYYKPIKVDENTIDMEILYDISESIKNNNITDFFLFVRNNELLGSPTFSGTIINVMLPYINVNEYSGGDMEAYKIRKNDFVQDIDGNLYFVGDMSDGEILNLDAFKNEIEIIYNNQSADIYTEFKQGMKVTNGQGLQGTIVEVNVPEDRIAVNITYQNGNVDSGERYTNNYTIEHMNENWEQLDG